MLKSPADTIVAIATAPGKGGVGIIRISGPEAHALATRIVGELPPIRYARHLSFRHPDSGETLDDGLCLAFAAPHSYTGEDIVELQGHGGPVVLDTLLQIVVALGARLARPGEFTERAFLNGRIDLAQAEAVADLIDAGSQAAAQAASRALQGAFSQRVDEITRALIELRMHIESALDFPEEEIDFLADTRIIEKNRRLREQLDTLMAETSQGVLLREGMRVAIVGQPNAGKSSLLNQLSGDERAIVTDIPGTTRDVLRAEIQIDGMPVHIIDTAGLRQSDDPIEQEGIRRAWLEIRAADAIMLMIDDRYGITEADEQTLAQLPTKPLIRIRNKIDLTGRSAGLDPEDQETIGISAKTGAGIRELRAMLQRIMGYQVSEGGQFIARRRHLDALRQAQQEVTAALQALDKWQAGELAAESLRRAQLALDEITGKFTADDLLGTIFSSFCIGK
ncbi:tRNA uridine(34) 5-carboxymethylaminomethyl synthesis GTPase MnmE [Halothiobacillus diazotrophicus]|uniref:tRNA modification GTPase MnmE n=1 Tax=Halothiobacillus diazotrophicus TaxID=1860122 RepID=A0A191ZI34_9GAMM|nr:tRNA uridine-5-carboxymethylaminomethyl(34) synthesis GTPase MnmE [Halothiobacillus diazotrophicus]ANJ67508.1 tRNA uridine(34) 5-carboxymethylaminomethyl synthesis GTPase MnmE [Halothiobacillus diazotrophicus]